MLTCKCLECGHRWRCGGEWTKAAMPKCCPECLEKHFSFSGSCGSIVASTGIIDNRNADLWGVHVP